ncbi:sensor histidine kinase [Actinokineospora sp. NPDC004072]
MRTRVADALLALLMTAIAVVGTVGAGAVSTLDRPVDGLALGLAGGAGLLLALRRAAPVVTVLASAVVTSVYLSLGYPYGPILIAFLIAVYTMARHVRVKVAVPVGVVALGILVVHVFIGPAPLQGLVPASAWVVVPFAVGVSVRQYREGVERARAEAVRQRVDAERLRLAQEVHDVVGHGLAAIKMQAEVALHVLGSKPAQAEIALTAISRTATEALDEVRAMVRSSGEAERGPVAGLARLGDLRDRMVDAGMQVDLDVEPVPGGVSAAADLAGYRVVQESLTNALRHGVAKQASVQVRFEVDVVVINVRSPIDRRPGPDGMGIPGMRERVTALGGEFSAGPEDGSFHVHARIPREGVS